MSDDINPSDFKLIWEGMFSTDEDVEEIEVDQAFLQQFGLNIGNYETVVPEAFAVEQMPHHENPTTVEVVEQLPHHENTATVEVVEQLPHHENTATVEVKIENPMVEMNDPSGSGTSGAQDNCEMGPGIRKNEFVSMSTAEIHQFIDDQENKNTVKKTLTDIRKFDRFLKKRGEMREIFQIEHEQLDEYMANFILSVRKENGEEYEPSSLRGMVSSVDRKLKRHRYPHTIMQSDGPAFSLTRNALKAKHKSLKKMGKGNKPKQAQPLTDEEIYIMYDREILGGSSPVALLNTVWLNNCIQFGVRGTKEQYDLRWGDITLKTASDGVTEYLELNERQTKTRTGENLCDVRKVTPKMFANSTRKDPITFYKQYASKRPTEMNDPMAPFYIAPRTTPVKTEEDQWFISQRVGSKKLGGLLKKMALNAKLNPDKNISNHSARKHLIQKLRDSNVAPTDIMQISGHKNVQLILNYSSMSEERQRQCSEFLSTSTNNLPSSATLTRSNPIPAPAQILAPVDANYVRSVPQGSMPMAVEMASFNGSSFNSLSGINYPTHNSSITVSENIQQVSQSQSMFFGATLHVNTLNVYCNQPM